MLAPEKFDDFLKILFIVHCYKRMILDIADEFINVRPSPFSLFKPQKADSSSLNAYCTIDTIKNIYIEKLSNQNIAVEYTQDLINKTPYKEGYFYIYTSKNGRLTEHLDYLYIFPVEIIKKYYKENILNNNIDKILSRSEILEID